MNFADVSAAVDDFRHACETQIGVGVLSDIGVRGPGGIADEAAFLRLTAWSYALCFESGRVVIPFLLDLKAAEIEDGASSPHRETVRAIHILRTWLFHSLVPQKEHDFKISKAASMWFLAACASTSPLNSTHWSTSYRRLCEDACRLVEYCTKVVSAVASQTEDAEIVFDELRQRVGRDWPAHRFDAMIEDSATRLGEKISPKPFRDRRIGEWKTFISSLPDDANVEREVERIIDRDVVNHFRSLPPITSRELMTELNLNPGPAVKAALEALHRGHESGIRDRKELLNMIARELNLHLATAQTVTR